MTTKSVSQQIIDEFIVELSKTDTFKRARLNSLKDLLSSGKFKKDDIVKLLIEEEKNENP